MIRTTTAGGLLAGIAFALTSGTAAAGEAYVSVSLGFAGDKVDASTTAVNHPTRCDSLLYADSANVPSDPACMDNVPRPLFADTFDLGGAPAGAVSLGYAWNRFRIEAEILGSSHEGETRPGIAGADNPALQGKSSEWSSDNPPHYRLSNFRSRQLFFNLYYSLAEGSLWTPYIGVGAGFTRIKADYFGSYLRRTVADGYIEAVGGDPTRPEEWQLAAAGSESRLDTDVSDEAFGYQLLAGVERRLRDSTCVFLTLRWSDFAGISDHDTWTTIRSHAPFQADGVTPFTSQQAIGEIGGLTATVGIRYGF